jgi:uncharacterized protein (UPF0303 family)
VNRNAINKTDAGVKRIRNKRLINISLNSSDCFSIRVAIVCPIIKLLKKPIIIAIKVTAIKLINAIFMGIPATHLMKLPDFFAKLPCL